MRDGVTYALELSRALRQTAPQGDDIGGVMELSKAVSLAAVVLAVVLATGYAAGHEEAQAPGTQVEAKKTEG